MVSNYGEAISVLILRMGDRLKDNPDRLSRRTNPVHRHFIRDRGMTIDHSMKRHWKRKVMNRE
ncbi:MAG: hypothetical protein AAFY26_01485 [Cyanobacteria bacterium J06638_22]